MTCFNIKTSAAILTGIFCLGCGTPPTAAPNNAPQAPASVSQGDLRLKPPEGWVSERPSSRMLDEGRSLTQPSGGFSRRSPCETEAGACGALFGAAVGGVPQPKQKMPVRIAALVLMLKQVIENLVWWLAQVRKNWTYPGLFLSSSIDFSLCLVTPLQGNQRTQTKVYATSVCSLP